MKQADFSVCNTSSDGSICCVSTFTNNARANNEYEIHTHYNQYEIYYFIKGELFFAFEGKQFEVKDGTMIIIADGTLHRPIIKHPCVYFRKRILFSRDVFAGFDVTELDFCNALKQSKIMVLNKKAVADMHLDDDFNNAEEALSRHTRYGDFCAAVAISSLLIKVAQSDITLNSTSFELHNDKILEIIRFIDNNLTENLNYRDLSDHFFLSEKSLYKFFKKETGFALGAYIKERRIIKAQELLLSGRSAKQASIEAGFGDYTVFYRSFLKKNGDISHAIHQELKEITDIKPP